MKKLIAVILAVTSINAFANCTSNIFKNGSGHMNNYYLIDEPPECCDDFIDSAKSALKLVLKEKISCSESEVAKILSNFIHCIDEGNGAICLIEHKAENILIQIAIEGGAQPVTHLIFSDTH